MGLRERRDDFLCHRALFRSSRLGLLEGIWSELCLNGERVEEGGVSDIGREEGISMTGRGVPSNDDYLEHISIWASSKRCGFFNAR